MNEKSSSDTYKNNGSSDMDNVVTELTQDEQREFMKANFPGIGEAFLDVPMMVNAGGEMVTAKPLSKNKNASFMRAFFPGIRNFAESYDL